MLRKIYSIVALVCFSTFAFAQTGTLKGVISDVMTGEAIPFANVVIEKGGNQYAGTTTDFDGKYTIKPIEPGNYSIKATFVGYQTVEGAGQRRSQDAFVLLRLVSSVCLFLVRCLCFFVCFLFFFSLFGWYLISDCHYPANPL